MELIREIGAYVGVAAFLGLAVLALLYFAQARDVRRLRESTSLLLDRSNPSGSQGTAPGAAPATESQVQVPSGLSGAEADAFRSAELEREAAERRQRFERRQDVGRGGGLRSSLPDPLALAVIAVGAALLIGGAVFFFVRSGDEAPPATTQALAPSQIQVAVLNSTGEEGLAGEIGLALTDQGYDVVDTTNTEQAYDVSVVMYEKADDGERAANRVAKAVKISKVRPMEAPIRADAGGAPVAVVVGEDRVSDA